MNIALNTNDCIPAVSGDVFSKLSTEEVFVDTCFMLSQDYDFIEKFYKPVKEWNHNNPTSKIHIYITSATHFELEKKTRHMETGLSDRAREVLKVIDDDRFEKEGVFQLYNLHGEGNFGEGTFFDKEILCIAVKSTSSISVLTRDKKLSADLLSFNGLRSVAQKQISVLTVDPSAEGLGLYAYGENDSNKNVVNTHVEFELY